MQLDYLLWPNGPFLMHLHSLLWLGALVVAAALLYLYGGVRPASPELRMLTGMFHFAAVIIGAIALAMIPALFKVRRQPPARPVVTMAFVIGGLPLAGLLLRLFV